MQRELIGLEAAGHLLKLNDSVQPAERRRNGVEFSEWLTRSPEHVSAYLAVESTWNALALPA